MPIRLINREREMRALNAAAERRGGQLVFVWGRRRTGKTYLLEAFSEPRLAIYYTATQQSASVELATFTEAVRSSLGATGLPPGYAFPDWSTALAFVSEQSGSERLVVVIDEFPYLVGANPGIESVVQRWWDQQGRQSNVMLILCGSAVTYMRRLGESSAPLHQRATASIHVTPFDYRAAGQVVEALPPAERAVVYGILGGTPLYLEQWDPGESRRDNLIRLFGSPASPLVDAAELVLSGEIPELDGAFRILQAIALGRTRPSDITDYAQVSVERPLKRLTALQIIERRVPALDDPAKTKRAVYCIVDPYFRFWFRFIASNRPQIARGLGEQLVDQRILPFIDDHLGLIFEEIAREHAQGLAASGTLPADRVESWWSTDGAHEIDVVGVTTRDEIGFVGTVKWSAQPLGFRVLANLDAHAAKLPGIRPGTPRLIYGRTGALPEVASEPGVRTFSIDDLYR